MGWERTIWVDHGEDVKIEAVERVLDVGVGPVLPQQAVRNVIGDHGRDPLAGVHRAEEDDSGLRARARLSKKMEALDIPLFKRLACGKDPG
jgi:hypothetical protein